MKFPEASAAEVLVGGSFALLGDPIVVGVSGLSVESVTTGRATIDSVVALLADAGRGGGYLWSRL